MPASNSVAEIGVKLTADTSSFDAAIDRSSGKLSALRGGGAAPGGNKKDARLPTQAGPDKGDGRYSVKGEVTFTKSQAQGALRGAFEGYTLKVPISITRGSIADAKTTITEGIGTIPVTIVPKFAGKGPGSITNVMGSVLSMQYGISQTQGRALFKETVQKLGPEPKGMAMGGPARAFQPMVVGERRPEVFVPSTHGRILPSVDAYRREMDSIGAMERQLQFKMRGIEEMLSTIPNAQRGRRPRENVKVSIRRGDQPPYSYNYNQQPVRPGRAQSVLDEAIMDTAGDITRGWRHPADIRDWERGSTIRSGDIRASVRLQRCGFCGGGHITGRCMGGPVHASNGVMARRSADIHRRTQHTYETMLDYYAQSDPQGFQRSLGWYQRHVPTLERIGQALGVPAEVAASMTGALSPNNPWPGNVFDTLRVTSAQYAQPRKHAPRWDIIQSALNPLWRQTRPTTRPRAYGANQRKALGILQHYQQTGQVMWPTGQKVEPFAKAFFDPDQAPIDQWMAVLSRVALPHGLGMGQIGPAFTQAVQRTYGQRYRAAPYPEFVKNEAGIMVPNPQHRPGAAFSLRSVWGRNLRDPERTAIDKVIRDLAQARGLEPRGVQAALWDVIRNESLQQGFVNRTQMRGRMAGGPVVPRKSWGGLLGRQQAGRRKAAEGLEFPGPVGEELEELAKAKLGFTTAPEGAKWITARGNYVPLVGFPHRMATQWLLGFGGGRESQERAYQALMEREWVRIPQFTSSMAQFHTMLPFTEEQMARITEDARGLMTRSGWAEWQDFAGGYKKLEAIGAGIPDMLTEMNRIIRGEEAPPVQSMLAQRVRERGFAGGGFIRGMQGIRKAGVGSRALKDTLGKWRSGEPAGGTYPVQPGVDIPTRGYAVGVPQLLGGESIPVKLDPENLTTKMVRDFITAFREQQRMGAPYVGTWLNPSGVIDVDPSTVVPRKRDAQMLLRTGGEMAAFDLKRLEDVWSTHYDPKTESLIPRPRGMRASPERIIEALYSGTKMAGGGRSGHGLYIVGEIGEEAFVPDSMAHLIPKKVVDQIPKAAGGARIIGKQRNQLFAPEQDGWIIPNRLLDQVRHLIPGRQEGGPTPRDLVPTGMDPYANTIWGTDQPLPRVVIERALAEARQKRIGPYANPTVAQRAGGPQGEGLMGMSEVKDWSRTGRRLGGSARGPYWNPRMSYAMGWPRIDEAYDNPPPTSPYAIEWDLGAERPSPIVGRGAAYLGAPSPYALEFDPADNKGTTPAEREPFGKEIANRGWRPGTNLPISSRGAMGPLGSRMPVGGGTYTSMLAEGPFRVGDESGPYAARRSGGFRSAPWLSQFEQDELKLGPQKVVIEAERAEMDAERVAIGEVGSLAYQQPQAGTGTQARGPGVQPEQFRGQGRRNLARGEEMQALTEEDLFDAQEWRNMTEDIRRGGTAWQQYLSSRTPRGGVAYQLSETVGGGARLKKLQRQLMLETRALEQMIAPPGMDKGEAALRQGAMVRYLNYPEEMEAAQLLPAGQREARMRTLQEQRRRDIQTLGPEPIQQMEKVQGTLKKLDIGFGSVVRQMGSVIAGIGIYGVAMSAFGKVMQAAVPVVRDLIDSFRGWQGISSMVTSEMGKQTAAAYGNVTAVMAQRSVTAGLSADMADYIADILGPVAQVKAGAQAAKEMQTLVKASSYAQRQETPEGLYGGYGGFFGTGFMAEQFGGGSGFTENLLGQAKAIGTPAGPVEEADIIEKFGSMIDVATTGLSYVFDTGYRENMDEQARRLGIQTPFEFASTSFGFDAGPKVSPAVAAAGEAAGLKPEQTAAVAYGVESLTRQRFKEQGLQITGGFSAGDFAQVERATIQAIESGFTSYSDVIQSTDWNPLAGWTKDQQEGLGLTLDSWTKAAGRAQGTFDTLSVEWARTNDFQKAAQAARAATQAGDQYSASLASQYGILMLVNGEIAKNGEEHKRAVEQTAVGFGMPDPAVYVRLQERAIRAQFEGLELTTARQMRLDPYKTYQQIMQNPLITPGAGFFRSDSAADIRAAGGGAATGFIQRALGAAAQSQDWLRDRADIGVARMRRDMRAQGVSDEDIERWDRLRLANEDTSAAIADMTERMLAFQQAANEAQWANQIRIAQRSLGDALGMLGQVGGTRLGYLQREQWLASRASQSLGLAAQRLSLVSQRLSIALQKRQIATALAVAQFQAPGETGEERWARQREAIIRAGIQKRQVGIQEQQFGINQQQFALAQRQFVLAGQIWSENARRAAVDARRAIEVMQRARAAQAAQVAAQAAIAAAQKQYADRARRMAIIQGKADQRFSTIMGSATGQVAQFGGTVAAADAALRSMFGIPAPEKNGQAAGYLGTVSSATTMTVGEAGTETVAVLRNPRRAFLGGGGGGGGPVNVNVNINGAVVRSDQDLKRLARMAAAEVERILSSKSEMLGHRQPSY